MKQLFFFLALIIYVSIASGQSSLMPTVLASASASTGMDCGLNVNCTIGEMAVVTAGNPGGLNVTEGFEQPVTLAYEQMVSGLSGCITGIEEINATVFSFDLFPNPAKLRCQLRFQAPDDGFAEIRITDIVDKELLINKINCKSGIANVDLDISGLSSGTYLVIFKYDDQQGLTYHSVKHFSIIN